MNGPVPSFNGEKLEVGDLVQYRRLRDRKLLSEVLMVTEITVTSSQSDNGKIHYFYWCTCSNGWTYESKKLVLAKGTNAKRKAKAEAVRKGRHGIHIRL